MKNTHLEKKYPLDEGIQSIYILNRPYYDKHIRPLLEELDDIKAMRLYEHSRKSENIIDNMEKQIYKKLRHIVYNWK